MAVVQQTLTLIETTTPVATTETKQTTQMRQNNEVSTHPVRHLAKHLNPQGNVILGPTQQTDRLPGLGVRQDKIK